MATIVSRNEMEEGPCTTKASMKSGTNEKRESVFGLASELQHSSKQSASLSQKRRSVIERLSTFCSKDFILLFRVCYDSLIDLNYNHIDISPTQKGPLSCALFLNYYKTDGVLGLSGIINHQIKTIMGACCDHFMQKQQIHTNESRLRLLEMKVTPLFHTPNDPNFTYFLHLFQQHAYLERLLRSYKNAEEYQHTEDTNDISVQGEKIAQEHRQIQEYLKQYDDAGSALRVKIAEDERKIRDGSKGIQGCMVKMQIQSMEVVKGISSIKLIQQTRGASGPTHKQEHLLINRTRQQKIYREFIFSSSTNSKIGLITDPVSSAMTIDVEDIAKSEVICEVFTFKAQKEEFGFIALRLQFVSLDEEYRKEKHQRLLMLEKELKLCELGRDGLERLSEYRSSANTNSVRNTILSQPISEYPNQYEA